MKEGKIRHLPVLDGGRRLVGIVTDRDLRQVILVRDAARLMHQRKIGALPVVKNGRLVGILTETDVLRTFAEVRGEGVLSRPYRWALRAP